MTPKIKGLKRVRGQIENEQQKGLCGTIVALCFFLSLAIVSFFTTTDRFFCILWFFTTDHNIDTCMTADKNTAFEMALVHNARRYNAHILCVSLSALRTKHDELSWKFRSCISFLTNEISEISTFFVIYIYFRNIHWECDGWQFLTLSLVDFLIGNQLLNIPRNGMNMFWVWFNYFY